MDHEALWRQARGGSEGARRDLIEAYLPAARRAARRLRSAHTEVIDRQDIESIAAVGLIQAVDHFDHEREVPFEAFARLRIRGAVLDELRRSSNRPTADGVGRTVSLEVLQEHGTEPSDGLAEPSEPLIERDLVSDVRTALRTLPSREQHVLDHYYFKGQTMRDIASLLGVTEARVSQIHAQAIAQLRCLLAPTDV